MLLVMHIEVISTFLASVSHLLLAGGRILAINVVCSHCISNIVCCCCSSSLLAVLKFIFLDTSTKEILPLSTTEKLKADTAQVLLFPINQYRDLPIVLLTREMTSTTI